MNDSLLPSIGTMINHRDVWLCYMLYDQGYVSQEKAAELCSIGLREFRVFCAEVAE